MLYMVCIPSEGVLSTESLISEALLYIIVPGFAGPSIFVGVDLVPSDGPPFLGHVERGSPVCSDTPPTSLAA